MAEISGENSVPLGRSGTGAAYVLGNHNPNALSILMQGDRAREAAARADAARRAKEAAQASKEYNDRIKFEQAGDPYFADQLSTKVYANVMPQLTQVFKDNKEDSFARNLAAAPILQTTNNETVQAKGKAKYLDDQMRAFQADQGLYNKQYAGEHLAKALRGEDGTGLLPSQFDEEAWHNNLLGDSNLYNEGEVTARATKRIGHEVSQKVAEAGSLGGQHSADQVRAKYVRLANGKPVLNADGTPALALTPDLQAAFESDPLVKLKLDAREAAYNKQREADPTLPQMSRRGHLANMVGPFAYYSTTEDEGLNARPPQPRAAKEVKPTDVLATPTVAARTSFYQADNGGTTPNHYAAVGHSFGSAAKPYVPVNVNNSSLELVGKDGQPSRMNKGTNGSTEVHLEGRDYVLFANGKRLGSPQAFETDEQAHQHMLKTIRESKHPERLELRVVGRGYVEDKTNVAGDGLGGPRPDRPVAFGPDGKPIAAPDNAPTATRHTVTFPISQDIDAALRRATKDKWTPYKASAQENEIIRAVQQRKGRVITPTNGVKSLHFEPTPPPPPRPSFLPKPTASPTATPNAKKAADRTGGML